MTAPQFSRRALIEARAHKLLAEHGLENTVIDPVKLANAMGAKVFNAKFGDRDVHGLLAVRNGERTVYVNADDPAPRKRFTVAHEVAHMALHLIGGEVEFIDTADNFRTTVDPDASEWTPARTREWEANTFAAALLMPETLVRRMWSQIADPEGMARWFQVSQTAMNIRLDTLNLTAA